MFLALTRCSRFVQTVKRASEHSGKVALLVSSGAVPNSGSPSSRMSTSKKYVGVLAIRGIRVLIATAVRLRMLPSSHQFLPVSEPIHSIDPFAELDDVISHLHSTPGRSRRGQPSWRLRSRRHDWRTSRGYGREMHSRSCWTCKGIFHHHLRDFLVDYGRYCGDRWVLPPDRPSSCLRIHRQRRHIASHLFGDFTLASVACPYTGMIGVMLWRETGRLPCWP